MNATSTFRKSLKSAGKWERIAGEASLHTSHVLTLARREPEPAIIRKRHWEKRAFGVTHHSSSYSLYVRSISSLAVPNQSFYLKHNLLHAILTCTSGIRLSYVSWNVTLIRAMNWPVKSMYRWLPETHCHSVQSYFTTSSSVRLWCSPMDNTYINII